MAFTNNQGDIKTQFFTDYNLIDQFVGGSLWLCGYNTYGQLGDNTVAHKSSPVQTVAGGISWKQVSAGARFTAIIKTDSTLWACGYNSFGQLADNTIVRKSSPVQTVAGGTNWRQVGTGYHHLGATKTDGTLWTWGYNLYGQLGDNTVAHRSSPVQTVASGTNWKTITCGWEQILAIKTDNTLWVCGYNTYGELGDNTVAHKSSPIQTVAGGTNWSSASGGAHHIAATKTDGTLWLWGRDNYGQLGDNTLVDKSSPIQTTSGGNNWKQVACGEFHTAAIKTDGTLWLWGLNDFGQLGDNTSGTSLLSQTNSKSSPVQTTAGGTNWKQVSCGQHHTSAVKTDGTWWTWGYNNYGQLCDNTLAHKSSPIQTTAGGTNWKQVSCGYVATLAVTFTDWP